MRVLISYQQLDVSYDVEWRSLNCVFHCDDYSGSIFILLMIIIVSVYLVNTVAPC